MDKRRNKPCGRYLGLSSRFSVAWKRLVGPPDTRLTEGLRDHTPRVHALVGARVVTAPGRTLENATIVVRDGRIEAVGQQVAIPVDALVRASRRQNRLCGLY